MILNYKNDLIRYLKDYEQSVVKEKIANEEEFMEHLTGNPIHAYRLMKRLCFDWETVEKEIKVDNWQGKSSVKVNQLPFDVSGKFRCSKSTGTRSIERKIPKGRGFIRCYICPSSVARYIRTEHD